MKKVIFSLFFLLLSSNIFAAKKEAVLYILTDKGLGKAVGSIVVMESAKGGIEIMVTASNLAPGMNGFHLHEKNML
ncbi:MAG: hypothetical protein ACRCTJ_06330, partial [Brevinema sp.]